MNYWPKTILFEIAINLQGIDFSKIDKRTNVLCKSDIVLKRKFPFLSLIEHNKKPLCRLLRKIVLGDGVVGTSSPKGTLSKTCQVGCKIIFPLTTGGCIYVLDVNGNLRILHYSWFDSTPLLDLYLSQWHSLEKESKVLLSNIKNIYNGTRECLILTKHHELYDVRKNSSGGYQVGCIANNAYQMDGFYNCSYYLTVSPVGRLYVRLYQSQKTYDYPSQQRFSYVASNVKLACCVHDFNCDQVYFVDHQNIVYRAYLSGEDVMVEEILKHSSNIVQIEKTNCLFILDAAGVLNTIYNDRTVEQHTDKFIKLFHRRHSTRMLGIKFDLTCVCIGFDKVLAKNVVNVIDTDHGLYMMR